MSWVAEESSAPAKSQALNSRDNKRMIGQTTDTPNRAVACHIVYGGAWAEWKLQASTLLSALKDLPGIELSQLFSERAGWQRARSFRDSHQGTCPKRPWLAYRASRMCAILKRAKGRHPAFAPAPREPSFRVFGRYAEISDSRANATWSSGIVFRLERSQTTNTVVWSASNRKVRRRQSYCRKLRGHSIPCDLSYR